MEALEDHAVLAHYRSMAEVVLRYTIGRPVLASGWTVVGPAWVPAATDLLDAVAQGCRWFAVPAGALAPRSVVRLEPGAGADSATAAMVALNLFRLADGEQTVTLTDGADGMILVLAFNRDVAAIALAQLADRAPEIATLDPTQDDGRVLLSLASDEESIPVPYSLVDHADGTGIVLPLHADEVAAVAAGMPLDHEPDEASERLRARGDLAAALAGPAGSAGSAA